MFYADYEYYIGEYGGKASAEDFPRLARQATAYLDRITSDRLKSEVLTQEIEIRVKDACCAVIDAIKLNEKGGGIASETNDGISVTYVTGVNAKTDGQRLYEAAALYLSGTGLLYRGVTQNACLY